MDQSVLIFVALICLSSPSFGRSWHSPEYHHSDNGFAFKPHHNHKEYGEQETDYDSSEEDWDPKAYTNYHRHDYGHHGYNFHVNHDHHHGSHEFDYHHHNHQNFGNLHNHGRHESHEEHHSHNNLELGTCRHNHEYRPNYQDHGQNNDENQNGQNHGTTEAPQISQDNINNEPNANPTAIDKENGDPADALDIRSSNVNPGSTVTEPPKSGLPNESPSLPREVSTGDADRVVFPDSPPEPITSSPLQPRLLSTPEAITQAPLQNLTTQDPMTEAPVQGPTTPALPEVVKCVRACPATSEYNPVCGSNNVTYNNPGFLQCARNCGVDVTVARQAPCPRAIPLPLLKLLAETLNVTMEDQEPNTKRASDVADDVTDNSKKAETLG